jgi:hypothetical protein
MKKISQLTTDEALDVFCEITPYINDIISDEELVEEIKRKIDKNGDGELSRIEMLRFGVDKINKIIPIVLKKKRDALLGIIAAMTDSELEDIKKQNIIITLAQVKDLAKDKDLMDFVRSCMNSEKSE